MGRASLLRPAAVLAPVAAVAAYLFGIRPRIKHWGATPEETARAMPMDEAIPNPTVVTHRAITIAASPEHIWPWLAQMGELPRGGFYSYEIVERLMGMKVANATEILPEHQHLEVGQALDRGGNMTVRGFEPGSWLVLGPPDELQTSFQTTWCIALYPVEGGHTRLVSRVRVKYGSWSPMNIAFFVLLDFGQWLMERKMLLEIRDRAEALAPRAQAPGR